MKELGFRLQKRAMDTEDIVRKRMSGAIDEISHFNEYDHVIINEDLQETYDKINNIIRNMNKEIGRDLNILSDFVTSLREEWKRDFTDQ